MGHRSTKRFFFQTAFFDNSIFNKALQVQAVHQSFENL